MSHPFDLAPLIAAGDASALRRGEVCGFDEDGHVRVSVPGLPQPLRCLVLNPDASGAIVSGGDAVLVWMYGATDAMEPSGILLGRIGTHAPVDATLRAPTRVTGPESETIPETLLLEARGDIVLRNGQSRIRLGAQGDVEIVCQSFATRGQRLLRLLAPLIKLN